MRQIDQLAMIKLAETLPAAGPTPMQVLKSLSGSPLALVGGAGAAAAFTPWGTLGALKDKAYGEDHKDRLAQGLTTDLGRGIGAAAGAGTVRGLTENWHIPRTSRLANLAMTLAGLGIGGYLGHRQGKQVGQELFPGSLSDRVHRAVDTFK